MTSEIAGAAVRTTKVNRRFLPRLIRDKNRKRLRRHCQFQLTVGDSSTRFAEQSSKSSGVLHRRVFQRNFKLTRFFGVIKSDDYFFFVRVALKNVRGIIGGQVP